MKHHLFVPALAMGLLAACDIEDWGDSMKFTEDFHYTYPLKAGGRLNVDNFNGSVEILGWEKDEVQVDGTKYASRKENLDLIRVVVTPAPDSVEIRTVRPAGEMRRWSGLGAKYRIRVPFKTRLERISSSNGSVRVEQVEGEGRMKTSNGGVRLMRYKGDVRVDTSNGPVELTEFTGSAAVTTSNGPIHANGVKGYLEAETSNSSIEAKVSGLEGGRPVRLRSSNGPVTLTVDDGRASDVIASTSNGGITVKLADGAGARVRATTSNSSVHSDFPVAQTAPQSKTHLQGTIGSGGPMLELSTSNGPIRIVRN